MVSAGSTAHEGGICGGGCLLMVLHGVGAAGLPHGRLPGLITVCMAWPCACAHTIGTVHRMACAYYDIPDAGCQVWSSAAMSAVQLGPGSFCCDAGVDNCFCSAFFVGCAPYPDTHMWLVLLVVPGVTG